MMVLVEAEDDPRPLPLPRPRLLAVAGIPRKGDCGLGADCMSMAAATLPTKQADTKTRGWHVESAFFVQLV